MKDLKQINTEIIERLSDVNYKGDLSDIGNEIGLSIGNFVSDDEPGFDLQDFISGLEHGISIVKGTHG